MFSLVKAGKTMMSLKAKTLKRKSLWITFLLVIVSIGLYFQIYNKGVAESSEAYLVKQKDEWQSLLLEEKSLHLHWLRTLNPSIKETGGDLIWNTGLQKGLMRFVNLPKSKGELYYHLWIYDLHQSQNKPVTAGVFKFAGHSRGNNQFYVPIVPEETVKNPFKFLLTIGKKSDKTFLRSQSLLLAQP